MSNNEESEIEDEIETDGYSPSELSVENEEVLQELKKLNKATKKNQELLECIALEAPLTPRHSTSSSGESPRYVASPRIMNQDMINMKGRLESLEKFQMEIISKINTEFITVLNKACDEISLQKIAIEELNEKIDQLLLVKHKRK